MLLANRVMAAFQIVLTRPRLSQAKLNARRARRLPRPGNYPTRAKDSDHRVLGFHSSVNLGFLPGVASNAPSVIRGYSIRKISARKMRFLSATACKRLCNFQKRLHRTEVPDRFFTHCPIEWKALE